MTAAERAMAEELLAEGSDATRLARQAGKKTADFLVNGVETGLKKVTA